MVKGKSWPVTSRCISHLPAHTLYALRVAISRNEHGVLTEIDFDELDTNSQTAETIFQADVAVGSKN